MTRLHLPSGITCGLDFLIPDNCPPIRRSLSSNSSTIYASESACTISSHCMTN
jgi:hypothetical protein